MKVLANLKTTCLRWSDAGDVCYIDAMPYPNGRLGLQVVVRGAEFDEPLMTATVNLPQDPCPPGEVYIKDYSENEGAAQQLIEWEIIEPKVMHTASSGHVRINRYQLTKKFLERLAEEGFDVLR